MLTDDDTGHNMLNSAIEQYQGHPRSMILVPIESTYATSY